MIDLVKLLKWKAEYGQVYFAERGGKYVVCRQPTLGELVQLADIQRAKNLSDKQQCQLIQRQTKLEGDDDVQLLEQVGEQILFDQPQDEHEYAQAQSEQLKRMNIHEEVAVYIAANFGFDISQVRKVYQPHAQQLFGLAKKIEETLSGQVDISSQNVQKLQVNPVVRDAKR